MFSQRLKTCPLPPTITTNKTKQKQKQNSFNADHAVRAARVHARAPSPAAAPRVSASDGALRTLCRMRHPSGDSADLFLRDHGVGPVRPRLRPRTAVRTGVSAGDHADVGRDGRAGRACLRGTVARTPAGTVALTVPPSVGTIVTPGVGLGRPRPRPRGRPCGLCRRLGGRSRRRPPGRSRGPHLPPRGRSRVRPRGRSRSPCHRPRGRS